MVEEWPLAAQAADRKVERARAAAGGRLRTATIDFLLDPAERLTEQERALMTAMLHGLVGSLADELRVRVPEQLARASEMEVGELVAVLNRAGLLGRPDLMAVLLKRADAGRVGTPATADGGRQLLSRFAADPNAEVAAAAMAVALARGRRRGRLRAGIEVSDLETEAAAELVNAVAAVLASRSAAEDEPFATAAAELLGRHDPQRGLDKLEQRLAGALDEAGLLDQTLVHSLAAQGEVGLLANVLARLARVAASDAWELLVSPAEGAKALLLRLAGQPRAVAAALFVSIGPALGLRDPADEIDRFDALTDAAVEVERRRLRLPAAYRHSRERVDRHG